MHSRRSLGAALAAFTVVAIAGCSMMDRGADTPNPLDGQFRHTCCNIHYEKDVINDANYQKGTLIPFGTRVQIIQVRSNAVKFKPEGHPPLVWQLRFGRKNLSMDQAVDRLFVADDPRAKLRKTPDKTRKLIEQAAVEPGMTREQVLMSLGYPPAHRTPSLDVPTWTYWQNRVVTFQVFFDGDKVDRAPR
jgi:outer membrane protein assembly factor BamE (lipoprotein component of BamABCDE complex)